MVHVFPRNFDEISSIPPILQKKEIIIIWFSCTNQYHTVVSSLEVELSSSGRPEKDSRFDTLNNDTNTGCSATRLSKVSHIWLYASGTLTMSGIMYRTVSQSFKLHRSLKVFWEFPPSFFNKKSSTLSPVNRNSWYLLMSIIEGRSHPVAIAMR